MKNLQMMTVQEVCKLLKINRHKLYEMIYSGEIPAVKVGKAFRISESALEDYYTKNLVA